MYKTKNRYNKSNNKFVYDKLNNFCSSVLNIKLHYLKPNATCNFSLIGLSYRRFVMQM